MERVDIENIIRRAINGDNLIGRYVSTTNPHFEDIRGCDGEQLRIDDIVNKAIEIQYDGEPLKENEFYSFPWTVDKTTQEFRITGPAYPVDKRGFINRLLDIYRNKKGGDLSQAIDNQKLVLEEVTGAVHTYLYELLQNANDYPFRINGAKQDVKVKFILTDHYLFFLHTGAEFNLLNIVGICSTHQGEKKDKADTIGYKGIGFKTVFVKNDYVYMKTGEWELRFDQAMSNNEFGRGTEEDNVSPWMYMPWPTSDEEVDDEIKGILSEIGPEYRVKFALRHKSDAREHIEQLDKVFGNDEILLFIPYVTEVDVTVDGAVTHHLTKDRGRWLTWEDSVNDKELIEWVREEFAHGNTGKIPPKFKDIKSIHISFAVRREGKRIVPVENARVFNYLPTEMRLGLPFYINADFIPDASRSGLHPVKWNDTVMCDCGKAFVKWFASLLEKEGEYDIPSVFSIFPSIQSTDHYASLFMNNVNAESGSVAFVPAKKDGAYSLLPLSEIIYDTTELTDPVNPVLTDEEFYRFSGLEGVLPHKECRNDSNLKAILNNHSARVIRFDGNALATMLRGAEFKEWLKERANNTKFMSFLLKSGYIKNFRDEEIILMQNGELGKRSSMYLDIDKHMDDLSFLSGLLPRIDTTERDMLSTVSGWNDLKEGFKQFYPSDFIRHTVLQSIGSSLHKLFMDIENNARFFHFMAINGYDYDIKNSYPVFAEDGSCPSFTNLYVRDEFGEQFSTMPWVKKEWVSFVHRRYFEQDEVKTKEFMSRNGIKNMTPELCSSRFIGDNTRIAQISEAVNADSETNTAFYRFYSSLHGYEPKFTDEAKKFLMIYTSDGLWVYPSSIRDTIFFNDSEWKRVRKEKWLPESLARAVADCYSEVPQAEELRSFISNRQIAQQFTMASFFKGVITSHLSEIYGTIKDKDTSRSFLDFLFQNRLTFFGSEVPRTEFKEIPVFLQGSDSPNTAKQQNGIFFHTDELDELLGQPWYPQESIAILDSSYNALFDGSERVEFYKSIGLVKPDIKDVTLRLFKETGQLKKTLEDRDTNLSFHRYFSMKQRMYTDDEYAPIKTLPIFIASTDNSLGKISDKSNDHYLPAELLTEFISKDLVPINLLDSVHPDYVQSAEDISYLKKIGNVEIDEENFIRYITSEGNISEVADYLKEDKERNIRFWRWACDAKIKYEDKRSLRKLPILVKGDENSYATTDGTYLPDDYSDVPGGESVVLKFIENPHFISPAFIEPDVERNWRAFFQSLGVATDISDIVFKKILPILGEEQFQTIDIVPLVAQYYDSIQSKIHSDATLKEQLSALQLKCEDGVYRPIGKTRVSGKFFDINEAPLPDIIPNNFVSEDYLDQDNPKVLRSSKDFMRLMADEYDACLDTATALRDEKIKHFCDNQSEYAEDRDIHDRIIQGIAEHYGLDHDGITRLFNENGLTMIQLYTTDDELKDADTLSLSSAFEPDCDMMKGGVDEIDYVNQNYANLSTHMKDFLVNLLNVAEKFHNEDLKYLEKPSFADYFWNDFATSHEKTLRDILTEDNLRERRCIPTISGLKRPKDLYDYRIKSLGKMLDTIYPDGTDTLPSINLPRWMVEEKVEVGFRSRLYLDDCLRYLRNETTNFRRDVIRWVIECNDEIIESHRDAIRDFAADATWINGKKEWVPLRELVAIEKDNETLEAYFKSNDYVCNLSYMPDTKDSYERLCRILGIRIIADDDFEKTYSGNSYTDEAAKAEIKKRLLYLAFIGKGDWKETYRKYEKKVEDADIRRCSSIQYRFDDHISTELKVYKDSDECLWYTKPWDGAPLGDIINWLIRVMDLHTDYGYLSNIFWDDLKDTLQRNEGGEIPEEFYEMIPEDDRSGLKIEKDVAEEKFENALSADSLNNQATEATEETAGRTEESDDRHTPYGTQEASATQPNAGNDVHSSTEEAANTQTGTTHSTTGQDKEQSDVTSSNNGDRIDNAPTNAIPNEASNAIIRESDPENGTIQSPTPKKESLMERLEREWDKKKETTVRKPASAHSDSDVIVPTQIKDAGPSTATKDGFFGKTETRGFSDQKTPSASARTSQRVNKSYTEAQNTAALAQDKVELLELFNRESADNKYSFLWFKLLLELMYPNKDRETTQNVQIDFAECMALGKDMVVMTRPSRAIPGWIDNADHLTVYSPSTAHGISSAVIASRTDDAVWLSLPDGIDAEAVFSGTGRIKADGTTSSFISAFMTRFIQLGFDDWFNLKDNLPDDIQYIYGPPGTGKTTELVSRIKNSILEGTAWSLVLTPTNRAADEVAERLIADPDCKERVWRFGTTESVPIIGSGHLISRNNCISASAGPNVLITTAARFSYDCLYPDKAICEWPWERVFIDEASMIDIATVVYVIHKLGSSSSFTIAGDPHQIQPVERNNIQPENIYQMVGLDSFADAVNRQDVTALRRQYRSVPAIGELVSKYAYDGLLEHNRSDNPAQPLLLDGYGDVKPVNFIGFRMEDLDKLYGTDTVAESAFHLYSVILAYSFAEYIVKNVTRLGYSNYTIGIVCPYKQQAAAISQMLEMRPISTDDCLVKCGTVHKFQGGECNTMIVVMNTPAEITAGTHVNNPHIVNVAISRARDYLFMLVPDHSVAGFISREILGNISGNRSIMFSKELEKAMFGSEDFIERNVNVSCHMPVNVYYKPVRLYDVRIDESAIDIQINESLRED